MTAPLLEARAVAKHFPVREGLFGTVPLRAVDGVDVAVEEAETLGLVGESGCGKSTLARLLVGLVAPTAGEVRFRGEPLVAPTTARGRRQRRDLQIVFQDPYGSLNPRMAAGEIVGRALAVHRIGSAADRRRRVAALFEDVGLRPEYTRRYPHEFSGGQRQRIAIARAIATSPRLVVLDETTSALDVSVQARILTLLKDLQAEMGLTYVFVSHNIGVIREMANRVAVMYLGKFVEVAPTRTAFSAPLHPYTRALLSAVPSLAVGAVPSRPLIEGDPPSALRPPAGCRFHTRCPWAQDRCRVEAPALRPLGSDGLVACHFAETLAAG
ncbi:MAG TPA: oligopeptide/dipeptide ABC transporter ATP-binding protein [bacterium]|nr:oligopeptide/dipeptide ABC transporter ATP-binding protein [bacterium]